MSLDFSSRGVRTVSCFRPESQHYISLDQVNLAKPGNFFN